MATRNRRHRHHLVLQLQEEQLGHVRPQEIDAEEVGVLGVTAAHLVDSL